MANQLAFVHRSWLAGLPAGSGILTFQHPKSVFKNAQPQNLILRFIRGLGAAPPTSRKPVCIDTGIACGYYTEFGIKVVIPRNILYRVHGEKPCIVRTCAPITRYNIYITLYLKASFNATLRVKTRYNKSVQIQFLPR